MSQQELLLEQLDLDGLDSFKKAIAIQHQAASAGFDYKTTHTVIDKIHEELNEVTDEIVNQAARHTIIAELGDLIFACCSLARHLEVDPAVAIEMTNKKFYDRFNHVERRVMAQNKVFNDFTLDELGEFWNEAKALENKNNIAINE